MGKNNKILKEKIEQGCQLGPRNKISDMRGEIWRDYENAL